MVTKGDWPKHLQKVIVKYPEIQQELRGLPYSMASMVRVVRNMVAHQKAEVIGDEVWTEIREEFKWFIMKCFAVRVLSTPLRTNSTLHEFALAFRKKEKKAAKALLESGSVEKPPQPLFRVVLSHHDGSQQESMFHFDLHSTDDEVKTGKDKTGKDKTGKDKTGTDDEVKLLKEQIWKTFQLSATFQAKIFHKGVFELDPGTVDKPDIPDTGAEWKLPKDISSSISSSNLDTRRGQLVHVIEERRKIQVVIFTTKDELREPFCNSNTFQDVLDLVEEKTGKEKTGKEKTGKEKTGKEKTDKKKTDKKKTGKEMTGKEKTSKEKTGKENIQLFHQKFLVNETDAIGSVCEGDVCEIHAFGPLDEEEKNRFLSEGQPKKEKPIEYDGGLEGLGWFD